MPYKKTSIILQWLKLLCGFIISFGLFQGVATALDSDRGQAGILVGVVVAGTIVACERILYGRSLLGSARSVGFGSPRVAGLVAAGITSVLLLSTIPVYVFSTGGAFSMLPNWHILLPGLFAQAGIAEEALFRGYLFRHLRADRPFWRAAFLSMLPFVSGHLFLLGSMPLPIAFAAIGLSIVLSFPFAHLFELSGNTIWAPALVHFVIQGTAKVIGVTGPDDSVFPILWMTVSAVVPWFSLLIRRP